MKCMYAINSLSLQNALLEVFEEEAQVCKDRIEHMGNDILGQAQIYAPVYTGTLVSSGNAEWRGNDYYVGFANTVDADKLNPKSLHFASEYAYDVEEFGTRRRDKGYHYMARAITEVLSNWEDYFKDRPVTCKDDGGDFNDTNIPF